MIERMIDFMDNIKVKIFKYTNSYQIISTLTLYLLFMAMGAGESISALLAFIIPIYAKIRVDNNTDFIDIRPNILALIIIMAIQILLYIAIGTTTYNKDLWLMIKWEKWYYTYHFSHYLSFSEHRKNQKLGISNIYYNCVIR